MISGRLSNVSSLTSRAGWHLASSECATKKRIAVAKLIAVARIFTIPVQKLLFCYSPGWGRTSDLTVNSRAL